MRGWICRLQLLLALATAVIFRSEFHGLMTTFYCLRLETPQNLEGQVPVFISPRNRVTQLYTQALGSLSVASAGGLVIQNIQQ
jgi:hypothetical protein